MTIHIFAGPTISRGELTAAVPQAVLHPPTRHGDLYRAGLRAGDRVILIDGVFFQSCAIRHKEITACIADGVTIVGAASMGALRASELRDHGMIGVGWVYDQFAAGVLDRDDEVAVTHTSIEDGSRALSEALVNIRYAAALAVTSSIITEQVAEQFVGAVAGLHFTERSVRTALQALGAGGFDTRQVAALSRFLDNRDTWDVKLLDARLALHHATAAIGGTGPILRHVETHFSASWSDGYRPVAAGALDGPTISEISSLAQLYADDWPSLRAAATAAEILGDDCPTPGAASIDVDRLVAIAIDRGFALPAGTATAALAAWASPDDPVEAPAQRTVRLMLRASRTAPGRAAMYGLPPWLPPTAVVDLAKIAGRIRALNQQLLLRAPAFDPYRVGSSHVDAFFRDRWAVTDLRAAVWDRGFPTLTAFRSAARLTLPYAVAYGIPRLSIGAFA